MTDQTTIDLPATIDAARVELATMTAEQRRATLAQTLGDLAGNMIRLAAVVRAMEEAGDDLADVAHLAVIRYARRIAYGQLLPAAVNEFGGTPLLLGRVAALPMPDQERVTAGESLPVMILTADGHTDKRMVPPLKMSRSEIMQVFASDHLRDEGEQVSWLRERAPAKLEKSEWVRPKVKLARTRRGIVVRGNDVFLSVEDLRGYLKELEDGDGGTE